MFYININKNQTANNKKIKKNLFFGKKCPGERSDLKAIYHIETSDKHSLDRKRDLKTIHHIDTVDKYWTISET